MSNTIWYTRCPVPTASGIAKQHDRFNDAFADSGWQVRNIRERGTDGTSLNTHFSHDLDDSFREGGGSPPVWARANGADTSLLGVCFIEETLGLFVRADDDSIQTVPDLVGKRLALPDWPELIMNFFRFSAEKAFVSALQLEGIPESEANFVDVVETGDHFQLLNPTFTDGSDRTLASYYHCQMEALLNGEVDAIFAKGGEIAAMQAESGGRLRMLTNLMDAKPMWAKVNNATPRILTVSNSLVRSNPDKVVTYARTLLQAANWAQQNHAEADVAMASETGVAPADIHTYYTRDIYDKLAPELSVKMIDAVEVLKTFLFEHGYIDNNFSTDEWMAKELLQEAYRLEGMPWRD